MATRLQFKQMEIGKWVAAGQRIRAQIICYHFQPETIIERQQHHHTRWTSRWRSRPSRCLKQDATKRYRITVESETMALVDWAQERDARVQFMQAVGGFVQSVTPLISQPAGRADRAADDEVGPRWLPCRQGNRDRARCCHRRRATGSEQKKPDPQKEAETDESRPAHSTSALVASRNWWRLHRPRYRRNSCPVRYLHQNSKRRLLQPRHLHREAEECLRCRPRCKAQRTHQPPLTTPIQWGLCNPARVYRLRQYPEYRNHDRAQWPNELQHPRQPPKQPPPKQPEPKQPPRHPRRQHRASRTRHRKDEPEELLRRFYTGGLPREELAERMKAIGRTPGHLPPRSRARR